MRLARERGTAAHYIGAKGPNRENALSANPLPSCRGLMHMGIWWLYDMVTTK